MQEDTDKFRPHRRKINIWASFIILSPYFGPLFAAFMISKISWRWPFWVYTIEAGLCLLAIIFFAEETYYDRSIPMSAQPVRRSRFLRVIGVEQWRSRHQRNTFGQAFMRIVRVISKPTVAISVLYYLFTFAWVVGINTTLSIFITAPPWNFGPKQIGESRITPLSSNSLLPCKAGHKVEG